jgi:hypothetical protein
MANNLVMWSAIQLAKKWGLKYLDMWGGLGPDATKRSMARIPYFQIWVRARHVEYRNYYVKPNLYKYRLAEDLRWKILRLLK